MAVGQGAQAQVLSQFQSLGSNLVTVSAMQSFGFSQGGLQERSRADDGRREVIEAREYGQPRGAGL